MAEVAFDAEGVFPSVHRLYQIVMADALWQDLEVHLWRFVVRRTHGGHSYHHQGGEDGNNCEFFVMQHMDNFGTSR
jgi:hypothetical protein